MSQVYLDTPDTQTPEKLWAEIAPKIFLTNRVRVSKNAGKSYPRAHEADWSPALPADPAAFRTYTDDALSWCIGLDFDAKALPTETVWEQVQDCQEYLADQQVRTVLDVSPAGGYHLYIPLAAALPFATAKAATLALAATYSCLDAAPMSGASDGLLRVPGSPHKAGGYQQLITGYQVAVNILGERNSSSVIDGLLADLASRQPDIFKQNTPSIGSDLVAAAEAIPATRTHPLPFFEDFAQMALTGQYDTSRYPSDSEARLGFARAAVRAGHSFATFIIALETRAWAGASKFWAKYAPHQRRKAIARDWLKANQNLPEKKISDTDVSKCNTRVKLTHPRIGETKTSLPATGDVQEDTPDAYDLLHAWFWALLSVERQRWDSREQIVNRLVLRALGAMAQRNGSVLVSAGVRSLALACNLSISTVSRALSRLCAEDSALIRLVSVGRGLEAHTYELVVPDALVQESVPGWVPRLIPSVHEVFFTLPTGASLVFEQATVAGVSSFDIARASGVSMRFAQHVLGELAVLGLVARAGAGWMRVDGVSLKAVAAASGAHTLFLEALYKVRVARAAWRRYLSSRTGFGQVEVFAPGVLEVAVAGGLLHEVSADGAYVWWDDMAQWVPVDVWEAEAPLLGDPELLAGAV